jgi:hypothetical protein
MRALVVSLCLLALSCKEKARSWPSYSELVEVWPLGPLSAIEGELRRWCHTWKGTRSLDSRLDAPAEGVPSMDGRIDEMRDHATLVLHH